MSPDLQQQIVNAFPIPALLLDIEFRILAANKAANKLFESKLQDVDFVRIMREPAALKCLNTTVESRKPATCNLVLTQQIARTYQATAASLQDGTTDFRILFSLQDMSAEIEAEKARSTFVANVSHELRSPLTSLIGVVETLKGPARNDEKARGQFLDLMQKEAERMSRLVADLLSLSTVESKEHLSPKEQVDLSKIIQTVEQSLASSKLEYAKRIRMSVENTVPSVRGDPDELVEVFQNLIENALKYSTPNTQVTIQITRSKTRVSVVINDIGEGIAPEHIPRLTERFYRVDKGRSRHVGGTGLGLAITKHILNRHRAQLNVKSILGEGTQVTVILHIK